MKIEVTQSDIDNSTLENNPVAIALTRELKRNVKVDKKYIIFIADDGKFTVRRSPASVEAFVNTHYKNGVVVPFSFTL